LSNRKKIGPGVIVAEGAEWKIWREADPVVSGFVIHGDKTVNPGRLVGRWLLLYPGEF
jgi:hypothetical protein